MPAVVDAVFMATSLVSGCGTVGRGLLSIPDVRSSNPVIGKDFIEHILSIMLKRLK